MNTLTPTAGATPSQPTPTPLPPPLPPAPPAPADPEGAATLIMGMPGDGKSFSLPTLINAGLELFVIGTEPRYKESLLDGMAHYKADMNKLHYMSINPVVASWSAMIASAKIINQFSYEQLSQIKSGVEKSSYDQFIKLLTALSDFVDERTGQRFGAVDSWGPDRALAIDSLSGVNLMALDLVVGSKPVRAQGEWGVAMDNEERLFNKLCSSTKCFFVLTAHVERETDEITGATLNQVGTLGRKLAPKFPRFFSEVVRAYRDGNNYYWSTNTPMYVLKKRSLPLSDKMPPDFRPIVEAWKARLALQKKG